MAFATVSDPLLLAALWTGCGALAATAALFACIVVFRVQLLRRLEQERRTAARWNPLIAECAERVPATLPELSAADAEPFLVLWCRAQESLRGDSQSRLAEMARRLGVEPIAQKLLSSGRLHFELLGVIVLGHLRELSAVPPLLERIENKGSVLSLAAGHALLRIDAALALPHLLAATARRDDWPIAKVVSMLRECDPALVGPRLAAQIGVGLDHRHSPGRIAKLLRLHVAAHGEALRTAVQRVLINAEDDEPLTAALGALWHPEDAAYARQLLAHGDWIVRCAAARALGRFGTREDLKPLLRLLGDRNWWVRYRAAQSICVLPGYSAEDLGKLIDGLSDRFAADILRQALADRETA